MRVRPLDLGPVLLWCVTGLLGCPEPEAQVDPQQRRAVCDAEGNLVQKAPAPLPSCYDNVAYGPEDERAVDIPDAGDCESALATACPFDPLEPARCREPGVGGCGPVRGEPGRWTCQCEGGDLQDIRHDACGSALALACPPP